MAQLIEKRYARALFELAISENSLDQMEQEAKLMLEAFKCDNEFVSVITHPQVTFSEKISLIESIFKGNVSDDLIGLFYVMFKKNREAQALSVLEQFLKNVMEHKRIVIAEIFSAIELTENQIRQISEKLSKNLNKTVEAVVNVDPTLIGGLRILVDGHIIDNSIKAQLEAMKKSLLELQLA